MAILRQRRRPDLQLLSVAHHSAGVQSVALKRFELAKQELLRAVDCARAAWGRAHPHTQLMLSALKALSSRKGGPTGGGTDLRGSATDEVSFGSDNILSAASEKKTLGPSSPPADSRYDFNFPIPKWVRRADAFPLVSADMIPTAQHQELGKYRLVKSRSGSKISSNGLALPPVPGASPRVAVGTQSAAKQTDKVGHVSEYNEDLHSRRMKGQVESRLDCI